MSEPGRSEATPRASARTILASIDLAHLSRDATEAAVERLCVAVSRAPAPIASVIVWPQFVTLAARLLDGSGIAVGTVANFPGGGTNINRVLEDVVESLGDGAREIELSFPSKAFRDGDDVSAREMLDCVGDAIDGGRLFKVAFDGRLAGDAALLDRAVAIAFDAGARMLVLPAASPGLAAIIARLVPHLHDGRGLKLATAFDGADDGDGTTDLAALAAIGTAAGLNADRLRIGTSSFPTQLLADAART